MADLCSSSGNFYQPMPDHKCIRVLSIDRTAPWWKRRYKLSHRRVDDQEPYLALSYRWQDEDPQQQIIVNGRRINVMPTVKKFLDLHLAKQKHRAIFIDSICVNQSDLEERAAQVRQMGEVYSRAAKVCVWLDVTTMRMDRLVDRLCVRLLAKWAIPDSILDPTIFGFTDYIFGMDYWTRAWVIQGLLLAKKLEFFWARTVFPERTLQSFVNIVPHPQENSQEWLYQLRAAPIRQRGDHERTSSAKTLIQLLKDYRYARASDWRDNVYALLGMADDVLDEHPFPVDYSAEKSMVDVLCDVLMFCKISSEETRKFMEPLIFSLNLRKDHARPSVPVLQSHLPCAGWVFGVVQDVGRAVQPDDLLCFHKARGEWPTMGKPLSFDDKALVSPDEVWEIAMNMQIYRTEESARPFSVGYVLSQEALEPLDIVVGHHQEQYSFAMREQEDGMYVLIGRLYLSDQHWTGDGEARETSPCDGDKSFMRAFLRISELLL